MIRTPAGLAYSPTDLISFLEGDFASWCDRRAVEPAANPDSKLLRSITPDDADPESDLVKRKGMEHEGRYLSRLRTRHPDLVVLTPGTRNPDPTLAAIRAGASAIYQPYLANPPFSGFPDFLIQVPGTPHYEPWDTKLARSARPYFLVQLCAYAEMLEQIQGHRPDGLTFILGNDEERRFRTDDFYFYYLELKRAFLEFQDRWDPAAMPFPALDRSWGRWSEAAERILAESDHLSLVANITRSQIKRLEAAGIGSMNALAAAAGALHVPKVTALVLDRLRLQARLQVESSGRERPAHAPRPPDPNQEPRRGLALLPPPSPLDVFFDMEGFPFAEGGLEYLFGATVLESGKPEFHDWWAHNHAEEKLAFEGFIDWAYDRWKRDPAMHIYHYAGYERTALKRLMGTFATRETEVDDLLRNEVLVDLFTVVRQGLVVGTPTYSLKDIERLFAAPRIGEVTTAAGSVVEYQRWLDSGEDGCWESSPILSAIRDYNRVDCESTWQLRDWLLQQQAAQGITFIPKPEEKEDDDKDEKGAALALEAHALAEGLKQRIANGEFPDPETARVAELLAHLLEYHRREEKPTWWRMYERSTQTEEQLCDDAECLSGLRRTSTPPSKVDRSVGLEYSFDPDQDTRLRAESRVIASHDLDWRGQIHEFDAGTGRLILKIGKAKAAEARDLLHLIPNEFVPANTMKEALIGFVSAWAGGESPSSAAVDLLHRRPPRVAGHGGGALIALGQDHISQAIDISARLDGSTLCVQGPPGTGKTYTAANIIAALLRAGKRIGVTSNSHKAIINLMNAVVDLPGFNAAQYPLIKVDDAEGAKLPIESRKSAEAKDDDSVGPALYGGTAWFFSHAKVAGRFDYLFVDEAGQVSLANLVAMGRSAGNLILLGDQMQLSQPTQGSHPGESGKSCLDYLLAGHATIPPELGIFLGQSRRMHPDVCRFISGAVYEDRLTSIPETARQRIMFKGAGDVIKKETGIVFVPVEHEGYAQNCEEEVKVIARIVAELLGRTVIDQQGESHALTLKDILFVSPFNAQVRCLQEEFGPTARVGSVDKFQGQEAPVVIISLASSTLEDSPRGAGFLLNKNRLNVAVSRAQALAFVVASPALLAPRCSTIEEMTLVNLLCRLKAHGAG